jgi:hypothetical protein
VAEALTTPFLGSVRANDGAYISPEKLAKRLEISLVELADLVRVHRNTLSRSARSSDVQKSLTDVVRILDWVTDLASGDEKLAVYWFKYRSLAGFDKETAADLVRGGYSAAVFATLERIENGVPA